MKTTNDVVMELLDRDAEAEDLEMLVSQIKSMIESPYLSDSMKLKEIKREIEEAGY